MSDLFSHGSKDFGAPLAERSRPENLEDVVGQESVIGPRTPLGALIRKGQLLNLIVWGPPGTGKTTFAMSLANLWNARYVSLNAIDTGAKALKEVGEDGRSHRLQYQKLTLAFIDEIHRLNKAQQDVLLPFVERGDLYLVGSTTENPSYEVNRALLSRCRVIEFQRLNETALRQILDRGLNRASVQRQEILSDEGLETFLNLADGDGRRTLNYLEQLLALKQMSEFQDYFPADSEKLRQLLSLPPVGYDKNSQEHYNCISAFIKSVRGSDPDATLYYLARMIKGGESPVFIARRMIVLASEDIGNAEPRALSLAIAGLQAVEAIGMPEAGITLSHVATFLACCPKSNRSYKAWGAAQELVDQTGTLNVPLYLQQRGRDQYQYPHNAPKGWVSQRYLPKEIENKTLYEPSTHGFEKNLIEYLKWMKS